MKTSKCQASVYVDFITQLRRYGDLLRPSSADVSVASIITDAARQVIQETQFSQYIAVPSYSYYPSVARPVGNHENRSKTLGLLRLCITTGNRPLAGSVFKRLLDPSFHKPEYIDYVLVPFLSDLRQFLTTNHISPTDEPFSAVFKSIVMLWASKVLGPKPGQAANNLIARIQGNTCKCAYCVQAFKFLTASVDRTSRLERIGAQKRKHLEDKLSRYAHGAAAWTMISSSPQGLMVSICALRSHGQECLKAASRSRRPMPYFRRRNGKRPSPGPRGS